MDKWLDALHRDKQQLNGLYVQAEDVSPKRDAKLAELKKLIADKVRNPANNKLGEPNRKVLVFTAFADTGEYLFTNLHEWARTALGLQTALVTGGGNNRTTFQPAGYQQHTEFNHILPKAGRCPAPLPRRQTG